MHVAETARLERVMRNVQMENVHPLRLRLLLEIERTGSISAAAETCSIAQPSASMHLRTLEMAIGHTLVTRTGRGSRLTAAGKVVSSHATRVLATLDTMRRSLDALEAHDSGELVLAASLTPSVVLIPRILRQFSDRYPGVNVKLRTAASETVTRDIARAGADVGIAGDVPTPDPVVRKQILVDELVGIAPPDLLTSNDGPVKLSELARHSLLVGAEGSSTRMVTERYLARADYRPARVWVFDSYEAIKRAVADGVGVSFASRLLVREEVERGELIAFRVADVEPMLRPIHVVQSSVRELTAEGAAFLTLLADATWLAGELWQAGVTNSFTS
jgi:molybdate transport repressor ModE-like protein